MSLFIESIKLLDGQFYRLSLHQTRVNGVFECFFPNTKPFDLENLLNNEKFPNKGIFKCRIVFDSNIQLIEFVPYTRREIISLKLVETQIEPSAYKSEERQKINEAYNQRANCDDIIMVNYGYLSDASYWNIALWDGKNWCTPTRPIIYGTQRAALLESGEIIEKKILKEHLLDYKRIRLFNAMVEFGELELNCNSIH